MYEFLISPNRFLEKQTVGFHNTYYTGYNEPDNPNFLNELKNNFNNANISILNEARDTVTNILQNDLTIILRNIMPSCICVCVPRAKKISTYSDKQLMFIEGVRNAVSSISAELKSLEKIGKIKSDVYKIKDGTDYIIRKKNTQTTHLRNSNVPGNDGDEPYPGITKETCIINKNEIKGQNIILIDDIYTKTVNIDEDCIQALYDYGANKVIFYAIAFTRRNQ